LYSSFKWLAFLPACFVPALFADQVVLKNGDTLTGAIVKKDGGKLSLKSEFLGNVTIPWTAVRSLQSDDAVTVVLPGGETVSGKLTTADGSLQVATPEGPKTSPLSTVDAIRNPAEQRSWERLQKPGLLELWTGFFDTGFALARGNSRTDTLTTGFKATRITRKDKVSLSFNQIYGTARANGVTSTVASAIRGGWAYNRDVNPQLFFTTLNDYEHDGFQNLDLRFVAGLGLGLNAIKDPETNLTFGGGVDYSRENFTDHLHRNSAEANFGDDFVHHFSAATNLTQSSHFFVNLSNAGQYRVNFDIAGVTALKKWLAWHVTASDRFLSNPVLGRQRNDLLLSTGFRVTFAR
jgi:putative salt-induced outer membrane protein YdiY